MGLDKNLSDALDVEYTVPAKIEEEPKEIVSYNPQPEKNDQEEDYILAREVLRNLIKKGNDAIDDIGSIARQTESARGFEVMSTLIKTVSDTTLSLYDIQKKTKDLKGPDPESDPRKKNPDAGNINVEQAVFVGSAAELLSAIKNKKEQDGQDTVQLPE